MIYAYVYLALCVPMFRASKALLIEDGKEVQLFPMLILSLIWPYFIAYGIFYKLLKD